MVFMATGMLLFAVQATGAFDFSAEVAGKSVSGRIIAPGLTCIILGGIIGGIAINKDVSRTFAVGLNEAERFDLSTGAKIKPPHSGMSRTVDRGKTSPDEASKTKE
jgi:hypothetical protein